MKQFLCAFFVLSLVVLQPAEAQTADVSRCEVVVEVSSEVVTNDIKSFGSTEIWMGSVQIENVYQWHYEDLCDERVRLATTYPKTNEVRHYVWSNRLTRVLAGQTEIARSLTNIFLGTITVRTVITQVLETNVTETYTAAQ